MASAQGTKDAIHPDDAGSIVEGLRSHGTVLLTDLGLFLSSPFWRLSAGFDVLRRTPIVDMVPRYLRDSAETTLSEAPRGVFVRCAASPVFVTNDRKYVNMADVNLKDSGSTAKRAKGGANLVTAPLSASDQPEIQFIELLFFAYRDFISDPDVALLSYGFGRGAPSRHPFRQPQPRHPRRRPARHIEDHEAEPRPRAQAARRQRLHRAEDRAHRSPPASSLPHRVGAARWRSASSTCRPPASARRWRRFRPEGRVAAEKFLSAIIDSGERDKVAHLIER